MARFRRNTCAILTALALTLFIISALLKNLIRDDQGSADGFGPEFVAQKGQDDDRVRADGAAEIHHMPAKMPEIKAAALKSEAAQEFPPPNYNMHVFYYTWYGNPEFDGKFIHWNHPLLPHWDPKVAVGFPTGVHEPPDDIGASFYPALGAYSSRDPAVIDAHMQQLRTAAVGVLAVSWYPPGMKDENGEPTEDIVPLILQAADRYQLKVAFHIEPYKDRDDTSMLENIKYIIDKYGGHPAFYRYKSHSGKILPLLYIYDSYLQRSDVWARLLKSDGERSVRNTPYDGVFVALLVEDKHKNEILASGFDGVYTYFATNGFSYGSSYRNWGALKSFCDANGLIFIPSVGPGYVDTSVRPWNGPNTRNRLNGRYYETALSAAVDSRPEIISVTSFNEWHEGTQIESAVPKTRGRTAYLNYLPHRPSAYLEITRKWAETFREQRRKWLE
ncbi:glycoprotein endo-alpha-1,2-mannosidase [Trichomycterus rosablanca]|uniref:glycoprotein endo-alpha-1,2-mannosidase n=1 Tax=Trichomycterus rosablanca TaxID=2290929 RepID=UPI002F3545C1